MWLAATCCSAIWRFTATYSNVKQAAARGVTGAATLLANLGRFFPRRGKQGDAPPAPGA